MVDGEYRTERDSLGELKVPAEALWGIQTQRAVENFPISGLRMPRAFIEALGLIKASAAEANGALELIPAERVIAIVQAAEMVASGAVDEHFPVDVFQTGSGTSSNMNANEVIAQLASEHLAAPVHPNDEVNMGQSSNDVIPTAVHLSAVLQTQRFLLPSLDYLETVIREQAAAVDDVVKTGRTHLMDAMPIRMSQEMGAWASQVGHAKARLQTSLSELKGLAQGGTAVGTGINAHPNFRAHFLRALNARTGIDFQSAPDPFEAQSSIDALSAFSGHLKTLGAALIKISNDLRWMNSGPLAGLGEISLPALQPGSSIMPGKVNPVIPEAVAQVGAQVIGNDATVTVATQSGNFQLNVMWPLVAHNVLQSGMLLSHAANVLADKAIAGLTVNREHLADQVARNPVLVTALNMVIGYDLGARIAKIAYREERPLLDVAREMTDLSEARLRELLDPEKLTQGGIPGTDAESSDRE
ncbi:MAG: class II fumarate hydratase [Pseudomonadota bacterium]|nr:class II fumarate hydratase [Pseudomonadota bacterium]